VKQLFIAEVLLTLLIEYLTKEGNGAANKAVGQKGKRI
jgi:hypothetical protein